MRWNQLKVHKKKPVLLHWHRSQICVGKGSTRKLGELRSVLKEVRCELEYWGTLCTLKKKKVIFNKVRKLKPKNAQYLSSIFFPDLYECTCSYLKVAIISEYVLFSFSSVVCYFLCIHIFNIFNSHMACVIRMPQFPRPWIGWVCIRW